MILRALAALALGGLHLILLPALIPPLYAQQFTTVSPELVSRYQQTLAADQGNLTFRYLLGVALLQADQNEAALKELQAAYPAYQENAEAHYNLTIAALRLGDLVSAEIYLGQVEALSTDDLPGMFPIADLYFNMALKSREQGNANEAIRFFQKVLTLAPERYEVYRQLGDLYAQRGDTELAIKSFGTYLGQFPRDPVSRDYLFALEFNRAQDLLNMNDLANAAVGFSAALDIQPGSPTVFYYLGFIAYAQDHPEQATELLHKAFVAADETLQQTIRPLLYNSALALRKSGKTSAALNALSILANRTEASFKEVLLAGTLNLDLGHYIVAHGYLQRAVRLDATDRAARQNLLAAELGAFDEWLSMAQVSLRAENLDEAKAALQEANKLQPQSPRLASLNDQVEQALEAKASSFFFNARAALDAGDFSTASNQVNLGLAIEPDSKRGTTLRDEIITALSVELEKVVTEADLARQAGHFDEASEAYTRVLTIAPQHPAALTGLEQVSRARRLKSLALLDEGQAALDAGQMDQAINAFSQVLTSEPDHERAIDGLNTAKQMRSNRLEEFLLKGRQASERGQFEDARLWFDKALSVDDSSRSAQERARLEQHIREKADQLAQQAEQANRQNKFKQARQLFAQALSLIPTHAPSLSGRQILDANIKRVIKNQLQQAVDAQQLANYAAAMAAYRTVLDIAPDNREALDGLKASREGQAGGLNEKVQLGQQALDAGDWAQAEQYLSEALRQDAYHAQAQQLRQRLVQARQSGARPGDEQKLYLQGVTYYTQGKYAEAIESWETVLTLNPAHEKASQNITKTKRKLRQIEEYRGS